MIVFIRSIIGISTAFKSLGKIQHVCLKVVFKFNWIGRYNSTIKNRAAKIELNQRDLPYLKTKCMMWLDSADQFTYNTKKVDETELKLTKS
jgi:hypothetical protein